MFLPVIFVVKFEHSFFFFFFFFFLKIAEINIFIFFKFFLKFHTFKTFLFSNVYACVKVFLFVFVVFFGKKFAGNVMTAELHCLMSNMFGEYVVCYCLHAIV